MQAAYRSSAAIIGMAFVQNIYGDYGMASLMIIGTVPLYNVMGGHRFSTLKTWTKFTHTCTDEKNYKRHYRQIQLF